MMPAQGDLIVQRWVPADIAIPFEGFDFSGADALTLQVRLYRDAPGDPLLDLEEAAYPADGLSIAVETTGGVTTSTLRIVIGEGTIEAILPFPGSGVEAGEDVVLAYAVHLLCTQFPLKRRWLEGKFIIRAGANQA